MLDGVPVWGLIAGLAIAGAAVAWAGTRLSGHAASIADRTSASPILVGVLLLGGATSLPEIATTLTATSLGKYDLAVGNLLGGVAAQMVVLAAADAALPGALSSQASMRPVLVQSGLLALLLGIALAGLLLPSSLVIGMGLWSLALLVCYPGVVLAAKKLVPKEDHPKSKDHRPMSALAWRTAGTAAVILVAGVALVLLSDAVATRLDLHSALVGASLLAVATSLPEISTTVSAARAGRPNLAFANILGTNALEVALLGAVDAIAPGPPILRGAGTVPVVLAILGLVLVAIYAAGSVTKRQPVLGRLGLDSWAVAAVYLATFGFLILTV